MKKIKILSALIFTLSVFLILLSNSIQSINQENLNIIKSINEQKAFTQEISKNIFYIYKNKDISTQTLDSLVREFVKNNTANVNIQFSKKIVVLWNEFYLKVQKFKDLSKITTAYSNVILEKLVNDIYITNLKLVIELDKFLKVKHQAFQKKQKVIKTFYFIFFALLLTLLIYLFTQLKGIVSFMQKFLNRSKSIIKNSTIKGLKPIEIDSSQNDICEVTNNFNFLLQRIDDSIKNSSISIEHSYRSIEIVEKHTEEFLELFYEMNDDEQFSKNMTKREDALIQTLEELTTSAQKLKNLKIDLENFLKSK
jgi:hypothetical protein